MVALLTKGFIYALITLGLIIAVQQVEAHVLQPLVMGRAVSIHPLAVVLGIAGGGVLAGIVGALLAVPTIAFLNSAVRVLVADDPAAEEARRRHCWRTTRVPSSRPRPTRSPSRRSSKRLSARAGPRGAVDPARSHCRRGGADCRRSPHRAYLRRAR